MHQTGASSKWLTAFWRKLPRVWGGVGPQRSRSLGEHRVAPLLMKSPFAMQYRTTSRSMFGLWCEISRTITAPHFDELLKWRKRNESPAIFCFVRALFSRRLGQFYFGPRPSHSGPWKLNGPILDDRPLRISLYMRGSGKFRGHYSPFIFSFLLPSAFHCKLRQRIPRYRRCRLRSLTNQVSFFILSL